jgi:hypothetical protein
VSLSRQARAEAAAADPNAATARRPSRQGTAVELPRPLTQAQLNARLQVVSPVTVVEARDDGGEKKRAREQGGRGEQEDGEDGEDEEKEGEEAVEVEAEEDDHARAQNKRAEDEGDGSDSESDEHDDEVLNPMLPIKKKPKKKRKKIKERKKRSLGHFLVCPGSGRPGEVRVVPARDRQQEFAAGQYRSPLENHAQVGV